MDVVVTICVALGTVLLGAIGWFIRKIDQRLDKLADAFLSDHDALTDLRRGFQDHVSYESRQGPRRR